jgi:hypothetical protein
MSLALKMRHAGAMEPGRRLAAVLASRNVGETVGYCAGYMDSVASRCRQVEGNGSMMRVSTRLANSFPKMVIVKEAGLPEHRQALENALSLLALAKGVSGARLLAAELMLSELRQDGADALAGHEQSIAHMRLRVKGLLGAAEASIIGLPPTLFADEGIRAKNVARRNVLELKRCMDAVYVLRAVGSDLPLVARSLALIASPWGRDSPASETGDLGTLAAGAMLRGLGLRYVNHSGGYTNIFLENRCDAAPRGGDNGTDNK